LHFENFDSFDYFDYIDNYSVADCNLDTDYFAKFKME